MGVIKRQGIKGTLVSYIGIVLGYINLMLIYPAVLEKEQIGLISVMISVSGLFAVFCQLGMSNTAIRFFPQFRDDAGGHRGLMVWLMLIPGAGFLIFLALWFFLHPMLLAPYQANSPLLTEYAHWLLPMTFFMMFSMLLESWSSIFQRITMPRIFREVVLKLISTLAVLLYHFGALSFPVFILLFVAGYAISFSLLLFYIIRLGRWHWKPDWQFAGPGLLRQMAVYSLFIILGGVGSGLVTKVDQIMLSELSGLADVAVYTIAMSIAVVIEIPMRALLQITTPIVAQAIADDDKHTLHHIYRKSSITQLIAGMFIFGGVWINADLVFDLMPNGDAFRAGKYVIFWIGISKLFDLATSINGVIVNNSKYYRVSLYLMGALAVLTIITNRIFIPLLGIEGAALATAISVFVYNLMMLGFVFRKFEVQPFSLKTLYLLLIFAAALLLNVWIPIPDFSGISLILPQNLQSIGNTLVQVIFRSLIFIFLFALPVLLLNISPDINGALQGISQRMIKMLSRRE